MIFYFLNWISVDYVFIEMFSFKNFKPNNVPGTLCEVLQFGKTHKLFKLESTKEF